MRFAIKRWRLVADSTRQSCWPEIRRLDRSEVAANGSGFVVFFLGHFSVIIPTFLQPNWGWLVAAGRFSQRFQNYFF